MLDFMYAYSLSSTGGYGFINDYTLSPFKIIQNIYFIVPQMRLALINIIDKTTFIILYLMHIVIFHCTCYWNVQGIYILSYLYHHDTTVILDWA